MKNEIEDMRGIDPYEPITAEDEGWDDSAWVVMAAWVVLLTASLVALIGLFV